jgi:ATP-binding cassette subfamily E protein 1
MTRIAIVRKEDCNPGKCVNLCMKLCPVNRTGADCIINGPEDQKAVIDEALCTGCGICSNRCPFGAIDIINLPEELKKEPIHRYGQNGFALYNLPIPIFGKVVGIIGRNGIGKSTAIQILSGLIKPNLGKDNADYDEVINYFKGTEAHHFFDRVKEGSIVLSLKPQMVEAIPQHHKGTVRELLEKVDEKGKIDEYTETLQITKVLDSKIADISGGELQRVAICATVLKKANVYFFDEPTSYLDIKQRINVSRFIQDLADEETAVMVVEHDLIILDYMADLIHLMYGKPSAYGIASQTKSTKAGINIYLSGFLKEENVRFRDKPLKFYGKPPSEVREKEEKVSWTEVKKTLGNFTLTSKEGALYKNEVVGVLGENGIGKTSFVKLLAGKIKPDEGKAEGEVEIAYKPQYIEMEDDLVINVLGEAAFKYENEIMNPLEIGPLHQKSISQLSGGELQRVAIAHTLSQKADVFLMDEPSAYLDVEQRMIVARVIRDVMEKRGTSALIVDHDLLFADYISDKIMVFEGVPAENGTAEGPFDMGVGMNRFLEGLDITMRRDKESMRPRVNKLESQMDQETEIGGEKVLCLR